MDDNCDKIKLMTSRRDWFCISTEISALVLCQALKHKEKQMDIGFGPNCKACSKNSTCFTPANQGACRRSDVVIVPSMVIVSLMVIVPSAENISTGDRDQSFFNFKCMIQYSHTY